jgi:hypothetical protein
VWSRERDFLQLVTHFKNVFEICKTRECDSMELRACLLLLGLNLFCTFTAERHQWSLISLTDANSLRIWSRSKILPPAISFCSDGPLFLNGAAVLLEGSDIDFFRLDLTYRRVDCDAPNMGTDFHIIGVPTSTNSIMRIRVNISDILTRNPVTVAASFNYAISGTKTKDKLLVLRQSDEYFTRALEYLYDTVPEESLPSSKEELNQMATRILDLSSDMIPGVEASRKAFKTAVNEAYRVYGEIYLTVGDNGDVATSFTDKASPWIHTTQNVLDITDIRSVNYILGNNKADIILAEHVWEHLRSELYSLDQNVPITNC